MRPAMSTETLFIRLVFTLLLVLALASPGWSTRLKDIASLKGIRSNQLVGYGLVVGLNGTGDSSNNVDFAIRSTLNMLERMGVHVERERFANIKLKNVAAVMVTANLPPFARLGNKIDVVISSIGDAKSLQGGTLLLTPLNGVDHQVYALAQGPIAVGGYVASGAAGGGVTKNHPTVASISKGAHYRAGGAGASGGQERAVPGPLQLRFHHRRKGEGDHQPVCRRRFGPVARFRDRPDLHPGKLPVQPGGMDCGHRKLEVTPDAMAKVIVNERTGTIVMGENVRISTVAVAHGNLSIQIKENYNVSQPLPFAPGALPGASGRGVTPGGGASRPGGVQGPIVAPGGATVVTPDSDVSVREEGNKLMVVPQGANLGELVQSLNAIGVTPRDLISILQTIKSAGALQADLEII